jgi:hypothetical protein
MNIGYCQHFLLVIAVVLLPHCRTSNSSLDSTSVEAAASAQLTLSGVIEIEKELYDVRIEVAYKERGPASNTTAYKTFIPDVDGYTKYYCGTRVEFPGGSILVSLKNQLSGERFKQDLPFYFANFFGSETTSRATCHPHLYSQYQERLSFRGPRQTNDLPDSSRDVTFTEYFKGNKHRFPLNDVSHWFGESKVKRVGDNYVLENADLSNVKNNAKLCWSKMVPGNRFERGCAELH